MTKLEITHKASAPLFDRLRTAKSPTEQQPLIALSYATLQESVRQELVRLFNVRSPTSPARLATAQLTVVDYGVPDFTAFSPESAGDRARLGLLLSRAVTAYEPRLQQVEITVEPVEGNPQALYARLKANLVVEPFVESIFLAITIPTRYCTNRVVSVKVMPTPSVSY